jgi:hypothetical protein
MSKAETAPENSQVPFNKKKSAFEIVAENA